MILSKCVYFTKVSEFKLNFSITEERKSLIPKGPPHYNHKQVKQLELTGENLKKEKKSFIFLYFVIRANISVES